MESKAYFRNNDILIRDMVHTAEQIALQYADMVYLGAGLHSGCGSAQRMLLYP